MIQSTIKWMVMAGVLFGTGISFASQSSSDSNTNVSSCCDDCYYKLHNPGAVPCHPGLEKAGFAAQTAPIKPRKAGTAALGTE